MAYRGSRRQMSRAHQSVQTGHDGGQLVEPAGRTAVPVIDVQVHPFDRNHPGRPWASPSHGLDSATGEEMVAAMNSVGVDGDLALASQLPLTNLVSGPSKRNSTNLRST